MRKRKIFGAAQRPRLSVFCSLNHTYVQLIDDVAGKTLASASTFKEKTEKKGGKVAAARRSGAVIADAARAAGIKNVVFDRGGRLYHGRVRALAEAAREGGLEF